MITKSKASKSTKSVKKTAVSKTTKVAKPTKIAKKVVSAPLTKSITRKPVATNTTSISSVKRKKIQTAEGWKRSMAKIKQQKLVAKKK